jgi:hypothetical protein
MFFPDDAVRVATVSEYERPVKYQNLRSRHKERRLFWSLILSIVPVTNGRARCLA